MRRRTFIVGFESAAVLFYPARSAGAVDLAQPIVRSSLSCGSAKGEEHRSAHVLHGLDKET